MYPAIGLAYSGIYPILIGYVADFPDDIASSVFTIFLAAGALGGAILPYAVGLVNQFAGLVPGMASIAVLLVGVTAFLFWTKGRLMASPEPVGGLESDIV
jgi:fucose permease